MPGSTFLRNINQARVLRLLKEQGTLSRAEVARYLGLTRSTVTLITAELIKEKLVAPTGGAFVTQSTGRPGAGLRLNPEGAYFLGAEIAADEIRLLLINLAGSIIHRETTPHRLPAFAENDANAAALAELSFGGRAGYSDLCVLLLNFGVGAGIISARKIFRGYSGLAGEIGHLCFDPAKRQRDEEWGILESRLGRDNLVASYRVAGGKAEDLAGFLVDLTAGGTAARSAAEVWAEWLALVISNLADVINPKLVVLAGPMSEIYPSVEQKVRRWLEERKFPTVEDLEIQVTSFGRDSAALGGAALVFNALFSVPDSSFLSDLA
jgi:predicted NBD/HSP70 family sugar kinase